MPEWEDMVEEIRNVEVDTVDIEMPHDVKEEAERIIDEQQLGNEGMLHVFATGMAYLRGERQIRKMSADALDPEQRADLERAVKLLMEESTRFATLRFKASRMAADNQTLAMREAGWRTEALALEERNKLFRTDEERLKARIGALEAENAQLRARLPDSDPLPAPQRSSLLDRVLHRTGRDGTTAARRPR